MNVKIKLYDSSEGDGTSYFEKSYDLSSFNELKEKIIETHHQALAEKVIIKVPDDPSDKNYVLAHNDIKYVETAIYVSDVFDSFDFLTCFCNTEDIINFPHSGSDYDSSYAEEKLGPLDFNRSDYDEDELAEKLFNYYLTKL